MTCQNDTYWVMIINYYVNVLNLSAGTSRAFAGALLDSARRIKLILP